MLHKRIATNLRSHFSTVGPSPSSNSHSTDIAVTSTVGPRLVPQKEATLTPAGQHTATLLPPSPPSQPRRPALFPDLLSLAAHRCASFFAEAAVLVFIFGILDRLLSRGRVELSWIAGTLAATLVLLAASVLTDLSVRRWLAVQ